AQGETPRGALLAARAVACLHPAAAAPARRGRGWHEHRLGRHPPRAEVMGDRGSVGQVVLDEGRAGAAVRTTLRIDGVAVAMLEADPALVAAGKFDGAVV